MLLCNLYRTSLKTSYAIFFQNARKSFSIPLKTSHVFSKRLFLMHQETASLGKFYQIFFQRKHKIFQTLATYHLPTTKLLYHTILKWIQKCCLEVNMASLRSKPLCFVQNTVVFDLAELRRLEY